MPPKSARGRRPTRASARKSGPTKCTEQESSAPPNDVVQPQNPIIHSPPPLEESPAQGDVVLAETQGNESPALLPQSDVVLAETLINESPALLPQSDVVLGSDVVKAKKMVKKTVKVVKKVMKKVPKKALKVEETETKTETETEATSSVAPVVEEENSAEIPNPSLTISGLVEPGDDVTVPADDVAQLNADSDASVMPVKKEEEEEEEARIDEKKDEDGLEERKDDKVEVKEESLTEGARIGEEKEESLMEGARIDEEEKEELEERKDEKAEEESLMEVDNNNVEARDAEKDDDAEAEAEGKVENKEEETGEGKLFRGELEAMERRKRRRTEIFIGGLDKDANEDDIRKVFSEVGEIVDLRVVMNAKTGKNKGFAFLRYALAEDARKALDKFAKVKICGKQCGATPVEGNDTIFLGNIDKKWKDEDVLKLLQEVGIEQIDKVTVMVDPNKSQCNRGFAFVEFLTSKDAQTAHRKLQNNDVFVKNLNIKVAWAEPLKDLDEEEMLKVKTVYAEFIPSSWDEEKVRDTFKSFGEIDDIVLARNLKTTKRKDFAFISYKTREAAIECIESFDQELKDEEGNKVNVKVSLAKPMAKSKKQRPVSKPVAKEAPRKKQKTSHSNLWPSEQRSRVQPAVPRYDVQIADRRVQPAVPRYDQIADRNSTNAELVQLLREQASWRPSHAGLSNVAHPMDIRYSSSLPGGRHQLPMLEADPRRPDMSRYPYPRLDVTYPVASSSRTVMPPLASSGHPSSLPYHQQYSGYPSGSQYGAGNYPGNTEIRNKPHGNSYPYHRY